ncbi:MAG TPA: hypothetical protein DEB09_05755 [Candidatus Magasanikbacteria bacterium]|nr:hypothetical protein [Candidatus Magasanikbacteria bacterium]
MKKNIFIALIIISILTIIGLVYFFFFRNIKNNLIQQDKDNTQKVSDVVDVKEPEVKQNIVISNPQGLPDSDFDGVSDEDEAKLGLNNADYDTDHDGISDKAEIDYGTDPKKFDTDGDGYSDAVEIMGGYNPLGEGKL